MQSLTPGTAPAERLEVELRTLSAAREREARKVHDRAEAFRARVLMAQLERWRGNQPRALAAPGTQIDYAPREARLAAEVLAPCEDRAAAALAALKDAADERGVDRRALALRVAQEELRACRLQGAQALGEALAETRNDLPAVLLVVRCESLSGHAARAEQRLTAQRQSAAGAEAIALDLLEAELALAREEPGAARRALGRAWAAGSPAAALGLAARDLEEGQCARAARLPAGLLTDGSGLERGSARRAWIAFGLALVPPSKANSASGGP